MKVFSIEAFKNYSERIGEDSKVTERRCSPKGWAYKCEGLTKAEMNALGFVTRDEWMVDVCQQ